MKKISSLLVLSLSLSACVSIQDANDSDEMSVSSASTALVIPDRQRFKASPDRPLKGRYYPSHWEALSGWSDDNGEHLWQSLVNNCRGLMRPVSGSLNIPARATPQVWYGVCQKIARMGAGVTGAQAKAFLQEHLQPWAVMTDKGSGLVTGYYEPIVKGSRSAQGVYQWPMYAPPEDLLTIDLGALYPELAGKRVRGKLVGKKVVPYDTRAQIHEKSEKPPVIVWLDDPVEAFFLQVQGSGRVQLPDGKSLRLAYADHNGRPYSSIGRWLVDQGELSLSQASMQNIKKWAQANPHRVHEMLNANQAMVFFKEETLHDNITGPKGSYGIPLVGGRAIAVDPNFVPLGSPVFLSTTEPGSQQALQRVVFAQDTGSAIKGAGRADFYWGSGEKAGEKAGRMKQSGQMWILWPKEAGEPSAS